MAGRYTPRTIGSKPTTKSDTPQDHDPETEAVRGTLAGNGFAKKYGPKPQAGR